MGMPVTIEIIDGSEELINKVFKYFEYVDQKFSTYKSDSEISLINAGKITKENYSDDMREVMQLSDETKELANGYFDIVKPDGSYDPSGLVKGWAIYNASKIIDREGIKEFYVDAGGDIQANGRDWRVGIKNPFNQKEIVKVISIKDMGVATSGNYIRGDHIYNPHNGEEIIRNIASLTVVGPNIYEADRFATAAFAMNEKGIDFIENLDGFEGYMINSTGIATMTSGFSNYCVE